ncbi:short-chain dehydrogenase, partial [Streptomyces californicus]
MNHSPEEAVAMNGNGTGEGTGALEGAVV